MTKSACPVVDEPIFYARIGREYTECARWRKAALARIAEIAPDQVILGSTDTYDFTPTQWRDGTARILQQIAPTAGQVHILRSTPTLPFDGPDCIAPRGALWNHFAQSSCTAPAHDLQSDAVLHELQAAVSGFRNAHVVDMTDAVCPHGQCAAERNGMPTYRDSRHLAASFVATLASRLLQELQLESGDADEYQDELRE